MAMLREAAATAGRLESLIGQINGAKGKVGGTRGAFGPIVGQVAGGGSWSGAGQPQATAVLQATDLNLQTSELRLGQAAESVSNFALGLRLIGAQWQTLEAKINKPFCFTVADDGTVSVTPGVTPPPDAPDAAALTAEVKDLLGRADQLEGAFTGRFGELNGDLPKPTAIFGGGLVEGAQGALDAARADGIPNPVGNLQQNWTLFGNFQRGSIQDWAAQVGLGAGSSVLGGGFLTGPDGRRYAITTPLTWKDGKWYSIGNLQQGEGGWYSVDRAVGYGQLEPGADFGTKFAAFLAGTAGVRPVGAGDPKSTASITLDKNGVPVAVGPGLPGRERPPSAPLPNEPENPGTRANVGNLATIGINGAENVANIDNSTYYTYNVEFQQNVDGRQRAVVTAYQAIPQKDGTVGIMPHNVHVDAQGNLQLDQGRVAPQPQNPDGSYRDPDAPVLKTLEARPDAPPPSKKDTAFPTECVVPPN